MTFLQIVQEFCKRAAIPSPQLVVASQDDQLLQIAGLANEVLEDIVNRTTWEALQKEATWTSTAAEDQGALTTLAPYGFAGMVKDTFWNRSNDMPIEGPLSAQAWQELKAMGVTGPRYCYRMRGGHLLLSPAAAASQSLVFEYESNYAVLAADTTTYKKFFTVDTDTFVLDEAILLAGLRWKWKYEKGLRYAKDEQIYEELLSTSGARDGTKPTINMGEGCDGFRPAILVQAGSIPTS